ncbi:unnamed protein product, partial [Mesorhabditis belari]|uniref:G-protein coupled receptors family 1 profile domain-containing protein n=1 Tax=Mesorhabditis belari TaxID=2138241 RepID=A0AAF3EY11_9BILA
MIISKKKLRNQNELLVIGYYCFNESLLAFGGCFFAIRRLLISLHQEDWPLVPRMNCITHPALVIILFTYYSVPLAEINLTFDRILALYFPLLYMRIPLRNVLVILVVITVISGSVTTLSIIDTSIEERANKTMISQGCYLDTYTRLTYYGMYFGKVVLYLSCCLLYIPVLWKVRSIMKNSTSERMRATARASLVIGLLIAALLIFIIIPTLILTILFPSPNGLLVFYNVLLLKPWMNVIVALLLFKDLRSTIKAVLYGLSGWSVSLKQTVIEVKTSIIHEPFSNVVMPSERVNT